ncbi:X-Pro dipeptidyl-peptidase protein [Fusarium avenaceum]|nr:X-Pro dipeptidyl-peptidase protein [Fusarium avenaceum]
MPNIIRDIRTVETEAFPYIFEQNVSIQLKSNQQAVARANVYRPKNVERAPVLITYGPYGKDIPYEDFLKHSFDEINPKHKSAYASFETPDPGFWTNEGYAVLRVDEIGLGQSPGLLDTMSQNTTDAFYEVIEWAAEQPWSNGKIGLIGISYFAGTQWRVASRRPNGLACIIPYEGMADYYRDRSRQGGIAAMRFLEFWFNRQCKSNQYGLAGKAGRKWGPDTIEGDLGEEELVANRRDQAEDNAAHFFRDDPYYASKEYNLEDIQVPVLSVGNWGNTAVHLRGNILGYLFAGSQYKFLRLGVGRHDLPFYQDEEVDKQKSFLSAFLKNDDYAGWTKGQQPAIDMVVRKGNVGYNNPAAEKAGYTRRTENEWPLARTKYTKFYLHRDKTISKELEVPNTKEPIGRLSYEALGTPEDPKLIQFSTPHFEKETEITGHILARLNVSATPHLGKSAPQDIDLFLTLRLFDANDREIVYTGTIGNPIPLVKGWQRVSLRKINTAHTRHREWLPHRDFFSTDVQPVIPGEVYSVDVEIWPTNVIIEPGTRLVVEVASGDTPDVGIFVHDGAERTEERFGGMNHIHFAEHYSNYITLPIIP